MRCCRKKLNALLSVWALACVNAHGACFYAHRYQGFHAYERLFVTQKKAPETPHNMRVGLDAALDAAYAEPTFARVKRYLVLQKRHMRKSTLFARMWERVLWACPHLDERARMPVAQSALKMRQERDRALEQALLRGCAQNYALVVCVNESNLFFAGVIKQFCLEYGWQARTIAPEPLDGDVVVDPECVEALGVEVFPSLFLIHKKKHMVVRLGAGYISVEDVAYRVKRALADMWDVFAGEDVCGAS